jgi:small subunit ribosomal protein S3e
MYSKKYSSPYDSMKGYDPEGQLGPRKPLPDSVQILEPPLDKIVSEPSSESREPAVVSAPPPAAEEPAAYAQEPAYQQDAYGEQPAF